jgi:hypothetical protein
MGYHKIAFSTTIFPMPETYLAEFFHSLSIQSNANFDVVILNDNYGELDKYRKAWPLLNIIELQFSATPAENRTFALNYMLDNGYEVIIFGDSDDTFAANRVAESLRLLAFYDVVVNDLTVFDEQGVVVDGYLSKRILHQTEIDAGYIKTKNIFGLSNTAIKVDTIKQLDLNFSADLIAVDWFLFSNILLRNYTAIFTAATCTHYRLYGNNTAGMGHVDVAKAVKIKLQHYQALCSNNYDFQALLAQTIADSQSLTRDKPNQLTTKIIKYPMWWEY